MGKINNVIDEIEAIDEVDNIYIIKFEDIDEAWGHVALDYL